ncbi:MAG: type I-G CRISPR-associated helicase/endonuclease Cas3g [Thermoguttaceae bacterium]
MAWLFRRFFHPDVKVREATPRRLVYCLPMRTLVEQTRDCAIQWLDRLQMFAGNVVYADDNQRRISSYSLDLESRANGIAVYVLMGGEPHNTDWCVHPERNAILIGTQDMLLSRALNRGYTARRARWPIEFGLLHSDCLWVLDEVQLMGSGLATTAQLDAFAKKLWSPAKPNRFLWMSATMGDSFLRTRDRRDWNLTNATQLGLSQDDLCDPAIQKRLHATKMLQTIKDRPKPAKVLEEHPHGRISLLIFNTVAVAKTMYEELEHELARPGNAQRPQPGSCLLHSRFRPMDRERNMERLLEFLDKQDKTGSVADSEGLIVVSTQVVEAGFDASAARLWSEIAPWPSVIQRLGRLNRDGTQPEASGWFWMPKADDTNKGDASPNAKRVGPYERKALDATKKLIEAVIANQADGLTYRDALDRVLATKDSQETMQMEPEVVIRPDDFFELFSTEPDLAGGFTNVAPFVRDQDRNADVHVFWRDFDPAKVRRPMESAPVRNELCPVPFFEFRLFIGKSRLVWEWDFETGRWESRRASEIQPGMTLLLSRLSGGYRTELGWTGDGNDCDFPVLPNSGDDDSLHVDFLSGSQEWVPLSEHLGKVEAAMGDILEVLRLQQVPLGDALMMGARWHDRGKSAGKWQSALRNHVARACCRLEEVNTTSVIPRFNEVAGEWRERLQSKDGITELWGKFPDIRAASLDTRLDLSDSERAELSRMLTVPFRPDLRHEAASALAAWELWLAKTDGLTALTIYLIACHHGKVRTVLRSRGDGEDVFGVTDELALPAVPGFFLDPTRLRTDAKYVGACGEWDKDNAVFTITSPSWLQMVAELLGRKREGAPVTYEAVADNEPRDLGPLTLAYLEALLRAADVRASCRSNKGGK